MSRQDTQFIQLVNPTPHVARTISSWENDPDLIPFIRPVPSEEALANREEVTTDLLVERLKHVCIYLILHQGRLIGEMNYQIDPQQLYKHEQGTAWISITIGDPQARGKGIGYRALKYLENEILKRGLKRIELGVFEFNLPALALYQKLGYVEIGRLADFTYWNGRMWSDIRMEKYLNSTV